jgi:guanyl-specific ribonuclease Sa
MRNFIFLSGIILQILGLILPAKAASEDQAFFALSKIADIGMPTPAQMSDIQLATVEGSAACPVCSLIPNNLGVPSVKVDPARFSDSNGSTNSQSNGQQNNNNHAQQNNTAVVNQTSPGGSINSSEVTQHNTVSTGQGSPNGTQASTQVITVRVLSEEGGTLMVVTQQGNSVTVDARGITFENFVSALPVQTLLSVNQNVVQTIEQVSSSMLGSPATVLQRLR